MNGAGGDRRGTGRKANLQFQQSQLQHLPDLLFQNVAPNLQESSKRDWEATEVQNYNRGKTLGRFLGHFRFGLATVHRV
jgi:hypothetical protein